MILEKQALGIVKILKNSLARKGVQAKLVNHAEISKEHNNVTQEL